MREIIRILTPLMCIGVGFLLYFSKNAAYSKYKKYWYILVILGLVTLVVRLYFNR